jgi:hypothetical protein
MHGVVLPGSAPPPISGASESGSSKPPCLFMAPSYRADGDNSGQLSEVKPTKKASAWASTITRVRCWTNA